MSVHEHPIAALARAIESQAARIAVISQHLREVAEGEDLAPERLAEALDQISEELDEFSGGIVTGVTA